MTLSAPWLFQMPTTAPKTMYEMERVWREIRNEPGAIAGYLKLFKVFPPAFQATPLSLAPE